jgi:Tfp pilus assembly protein PilX
MCDLRFCFSRKNRPAAREDERGVAMLTALLLLILLTGMGLAMVMSVNSGLLVNGYYRNFRGSFYAADSGLALARQQMIAQVNSDSSGWTPSATTMPISSTEDTTIKTTVTTDYGNWTAITGTGTGDAAGSWPEQFKITNVTVTPTTLTITCSANCNSSPAPSPATTTLTCTGTSGGSGFTCPFTTAPANANSYNYYYLYSLTAQGKAGGSQAVTLTDNGYLVVAASQAPTTTSFAAYGMFINSFAPCSGTLVPGTISGPVFTNGSWTFGTSGPYTFTGSVGQVGSTAGYQFADGTCNTVAGSSDTESGTHNTIDPNFEQGFNLGQNTVPLPSNSYSQEQAVVDSVGASQFNQSSPGSLKLAGSAQTPFPTTGTVPNGVYLPYTGSLTGGTGVFNGGGILVQGDAAVTLSTTGTGTQVYTIVQGSGTSAVTTTIQMTPAAIPPSSGTLGAGTTVVSTQTGSGAVTTYPPISGVPVVDNSSSQVTGDGTMLYVNGNITSLTGPSSGAAIQNYSNVTVTAADNITITGNITYATEPVNSSDVLTSNASQSGTLGIFTAGTGCSGSTCGDINLNFPTNNGNYEIDASIASISQTNNGGLVNTGNAINTLTIVGGRIQNSIQDINTTTRNVLFDVRYANGTVSPPWFPSTTITPTSFTVSPSIQRLSWLNNSPTY